MIKKNKIPTIIGIFMLLSGVFAGVFLLRNNQIFKIGASPTITPNDVRISNVSGSSATISWISEDETSGFISYGITANTGTIVYEDNNDLEYQTHSITLTGLSPETEYYFKINSNGTYFDNNGVVWQFTSGKDLNISQASIPVSGTLITASGQPSKRALIYITINGYLLSTVTSESGTFVIQLGSARTTDLASYQKIDLAKTLLEVSALTPAGETATAKVFPKSADPIPALIVGKDQDFRGLENVSDGQNPGVDLSLPENATKSSKFDLSGEKTSTASSVTLDSINEGEVVSSDQPEFFGEGPRGGEITITVHSDTEYTGTTKVASDGSWSWAVPSNLSPGAHTITLSWIDTSGITRTLTRSFVVQASELPAFVASGSATPTATPKVTASPTPAATIKATATPTATPKVTSSATPASLPSSGESYPTIALFAISIGILIFSFYTWRESKV